MKIEADAEAHALMAKYRADARGEYERLARKAEGLGMIVQNCGGADKAFQLLMLEQLQPLAKESAKAISNLNLTRSLFGKMAAEVEMVVVVPRQTLFEISHLLYLRDGCLEHVGGFEIIEQLMPSTNSAAVTGPMKDYQNELMETSY